MRRRQRPEAWALLGMATFALGWAAMCAIGRVKFGVDQAFAPRYGSAALLFWSGLLVDVVSAFGSTIVCNALVAAWARWLGEPLTRYVSRRDDRACPGYLDHGRAVRGLLGRRVPERSIHLNVARAHELAAN